MEHEKIRVVVETEQRTFRGFIHKPIKDASFRLSDHLNSHQGRFIALSDVTINERNQQYRAGDRRDFVAISISSISYLAPIEE